MSREVCSEHHQYRSACPCGQTDRIVEADDRIAEALERIADIMWVQLETDEQRQNVIDMGRARR